MVGVLIWGAFKGGAWGYTASPLSPSQGVYAFALPGLCPPGLIRGS